MDEVRRRADESAVAASLQGREDLLGHHESARRSRIPLASSAEDQDVGIESENLLEADAMRTVQRLRARLRYENAQP